MTNDKFTKQTTPIFTFYILHYKLTKIALERIIILRYP
jgi:hypothetical protein